MANHDELVAEMLFIDKMQMIDRLKLARKRRAQQLKQFAQYEKQLNKDVNKRTKRSSSAALNGLVSTGSGGGATTAAAAAAGRLKQSRRRLRFADSVLLLDATIRNDVDEVKNLLNGGISPDTANIDGLTALHQCCIDNLEEMLRLLIERGANVNARDTELWTPLHAAATCGHVRLCRYLCDHGADLLAVNADGNMPYDLCEDLSTLDYIESEMAKRGITQELIDETRLTAENAMLSDMQNIVNDGGDLDHRGPGGETALHIAACYGYVSVVDFLLSQHVSIDAVDNDEWRPVHCASCWGQYAVLEILLEHGADIEARTRNGETALDLCEDVEMKQRIVELMDEIRNKRSTRLRLQDANSSRRNSSARRSSMVNPASHGLCIRRSSLHEKNSLSAKDVREEARFLRESISSLNDGEDDDDDELILDAITVTPDQVNTVILLTSPTEAADESTNNNNNSSSSRKNNKSSTPVRSGPTPPSITVTPAGASDMPQSPAGGSRQLADETPTKDPESRRQRHQQKQKLPQEQQQPRRPPSTPSSFPPSCATSPHPAGIPPTGTLSDLKKHRSKQRERLLMQEQPSPAHANGASEDGAKVAEISNGRGSSSAAVEGQPLNRSSLSVDEIYGNNSQTAKRTNENGGGTREDGCCRIM